MAKVLFVCTGNVTRSMTAEHLFLDYMAKLGSSTFSVASAGIKPHHNDDIFPELVERFHALGVDVHHHKPTLLTQKLIDGSDVIVCMTHKQLKAIKDQFGITAYLFNSLARGTSEDLQDDAESHTDMEKIDEFCDDLFDYMQIHIPKVYEKLVVLNESGF